MKLASSPRAIYLYFPKHCLDRSPGGKVILI